MIVMTTMAMLVVTIYRPLVTILIPNGNSATNEMMVLVMMVMTM